MLGYSRITFGTIYKSEVYHRRRHHPQALRNSIGTIDCTTSSLLFLEKVEKKRNKHAKNIKKGVLVFVTIFPWLSMKDECLSFSCVCQFFFSSIEKLAYL